MKTSEFLEIIAAAKDGKHKVKGLAYSGGKMRLFGWSRPVVVDLSGMNIPGDVPLLTDHTNFTEGRIGVVTATLTESGLEIAGEIVAGGFDRGTQPYPSRSGCCKRRKRWREGTLDLF